MKFPLVVLSTLLATSSTYAFAPASNRAFRKRNFPVVKSALVENGIFVDELELAINKQLDYQPGKADTVFASRFGDIANGRSIKTVGENFAEFSKSLGHPINPLYRSAISDIVGTTHLIVVNRRFQRDSIWSLGLLTTLDLILKNYPEKEIATGIRKSLFKSIGLNEEEIENEAKEIINWVQGKKREEITAALSGEGDSTIATFAKAAKSDEYWMYSKWFGVGLIRIMEIIGVQNESETCYPIIEEWVGEKLEKPYFTACTDCDQYFRTKNKLEMFETLMKEVEIREKKRLAQKLEEKAEAALVKAEKEAKRKASEEVGVKEKVLTVNEA